MGNDISRRRPPATRRPVTQKLTTTVSPTTYTTTTPITTPTTSATAIETTTHVFTTSLEEVTSFDQLTSKSSASWDGQLSTSVTSFGLSTFQQFTTPSPSMPVTSSFLLPLAIVLSASLLIVAFIFFALLYRRRQNSIKQQLIAEKNGPMALEVYSESASADRSGNAKDHHINHIYVEHFEQDGKVQVPDAQYAYVSKPKMTGIGRRAIAPSPVNDGKVIRGKPDGGIKPKHIKGSPTDVFGDEDQYNLLFEDTPQILNLIITNSYKNHPVERQPSYATITELPGLTYYYDVSQEDASTGAREMLSLEDLTPPHSNRDSGHESGSVTSQADPNQCDDVISNLDGTATDQSKAVADVSSQQLALYENARRSRLGTTDSQHSGDPNYYVLDGPSAEEISIICEEENILYQSITE